MSVFFFFWLDLIFVRFIHIDARSCSSLSFLCPFCLWADWVVSSMGLLRWCCCEHSCICLLVNKCPHFCWIWAYLGVELLSHGADVCSALIDAAKQFSKEIIPITLSPVLCENSSCSPFLPSSMCSIESFFHCSPFDECQLHLLSPSFLHWSATYVI